MANASDERPRLRELRMERGWTQQETAERLARLAYMRFRDRAAVNADMVAKWERGVKRPSPRYRDLLCLLFGVTADQLGIGPSARQHSAPVPAPPAHDDSLVSMLDNTASLLDNFGAAGATLAPKAFEVWTEALAERHGRFAPVRPARSNAAPVKVDDLDELADRFAELYGSAPPSALLTAVTAHVRMTAEALGAELSRGERRRVLANRARVAILAGRLSADDIGDSTAGHAYYTIAINAAREAGDNQTAAIAHGYAAELANADHCPTAALDHLTAARDLAGNDRPVSSWLATIEATVHAEHGDHDQATDALDRAGTPAKRDTDDTRALLDPNGPAQVNAAAGRVHLRAGDYPGARDAFAAALDHLDPGDRRHRVVYLLDQATAELHQGHHAQACELAGTAASYLRHTQYATGTRRLHTFRATAQRVLDRRTMRALDALTEAVA